MAMPSWPEHEKPASTPPPPPSSRKKQKERLHLVLDEEEEQEADPMEISSDILEDFPKTPEQDSLRKGVFVSRDEFRKIADLLLDKKATEAQLLAHPEQFGMSPGRMKNAIEMVRLREHGEEARAQTDESMVFSLEQLERVREALEKKGSHKGVVEMHEELGLNKAQVRRALRVLANPLSNRPLNTDVPSADDLMDRRDKRMAERFAFGEMVEKAKAFMRAGNTARFTDVSHGVNIPEELLVPVFEELEREGFLARANKGRWVIRKENPTAAVFATADEKLADPELQDAVERLPEIREVLSKTHNAYPDYLKWRFGMSDVQATYALRTLREEGFLKEGEDGEMWIFPNGASGESYPVLFPEDTPRAGLAELPHEEASDVEVELVDPSLQPPKMHPRRKAGERNILPPLESEPIQDDRPLTREDLTPENPPAIDPNLSVVAPRRRRGERRVINPSAPDYHYQEPEVTVDAMPPALPKRGKKGERIVEAPPRPYEYHLKKAEEKYRLKPATPEALEEAKRRVKFYNEPFVYEEDVTDDAELLEDEKKADGASPDVADGGSPDTSPDSSPDTAPDSGVREKILKGDAQKKLEELQHVLAFSPDDPVTREYLQGRVEKLKAVVERAELEEQRGIVQRRIEEIDEELEELAPELEKAELAFQRAQKELEKKQAESTDARDHYASLPGAVEIPDSLAEQEKQVAAWRKAAEGSLRHDPGHDELIALAEAMERVMKTNGALERAQDTSRAARESRDGFVQERTELLAERTESQEKEKGFLDRITVLDAMIGAATLAALAWEKPEESAEVKEVREQVAAAERAAAERRAANKAFDDKEEAERKKVKEFAWKWSWRGAGVVGGVFWLGFKAAELLFHAILHPIQSIKYLWNKLVKLVEDGGGSGKTPHPA